MFSCSYLSDIMRNCRYMTYASVFDYDNIVQTSVASSLLALVHVNNSHCKLITVIDFNIQLI